MLHPNSLFHDPAAVEAGKHIVDGYMAIAEATLEAAEQDNIATQLHRIIATDYSHLAGLGIAEIAGSNDEASAEYGRFYEAFSEADDTAFLMLGRRLGLARTLSEFITKNHHGHRIELRPPSDQSPEERASGERCHRLNGIIMPQQVGQTAMGFLSVWKTNMFVLGVEPRAIQIVTPELQPRFEIAVAPGL